MLIAEEECNYITLAPTREFILVRHDKQVLQRAFQYIKHVLITKPEAEVVWERAN